MLGLFLELFESLVYRVNLFGQERSVGLQELDLLRFRLSVDCCHCMFEGLGRLLQALVYRRRNFRADILDEFAG